MGGPTGIRRRKFAPRMSPRRVTRTWCSRRVSTLPREKAVPHHTARPPGRAGARPSSPPRCAGCTRPARTATQCGSATLSHPPAKLVHDDTANLRPLSSRAGLLDVPPGIYCGVVAGIESGCCVARIAVRAVPGGCLTADYEATSDQHGLQHSEHALVSDDALYVAFGEGRGVTVLTAVAQDVYETATERRMRIAAAYKDGELSWVWYWGGEGPAGALRARGRHRPGDGDRPAADRRPVLDHERAALGRGDRCPRGPGVPRMDRRTGHRPPRPGRSSDLDRGRNCGGPRAATLCRVTNSAVADVLGACDPLDQRAWTMRSINFRVSVR